MSKFQNLLALSLLFASPVALCGSPGTVHSLDQLPKAFKSKEGLAKFNEQMSGTPLPDGFGTALPEGLSAGSIVELTAPGSDAALATLVGAKAWPHRANTFIAIVCLAADKQELDSARRNNSGKPSCESSPAEVHLAMLEYSGKRASPKLVASYGKALDVGTLWDFSNLDGPVDADDTPLRPSSYSRFDFAPFRISASETAFGVRVGWSEGYAGGGASFQALMLFIQRGEQLINVLSEPVYFWKNIAGEWHKNGTRDHDLSEGENVLSVLPHQTSGHHDLQMKTRGGKWHQIFVWSEQDQAYKPEIPQAATKPRP